MISPLILSNSSAPSSNSSSVVDSFGFSSGITLCSGSVLYSGSALCFVIFATSFCKSGLFSNDVTGFGIDID